MTPKIQAAIAGILATPILLLILAVVALNLLK